jgi:hypothetical protein
VDLGVGGFGRLRPGTAYSCVAGVFSETALQKAEEGTKGALAGGTRFQLEDPRWIDLREPRVSWAEYSEAIVARSADVARHRAALSRLYSDRLPKEIQLDGSFQDWRFNVFVPEPGRLVAELFRVGLFASRHYASLGGGVFCEGSFPQTEKAHRSIVNLFNDLNYSVEQAERTAAIVVRHLESRG